MGKLLTQGQCSFASNPTIEKFRSPGERICSRRRWKRGFTIQASCGGEGVCGKCQVRIEQGEVERTRGAKIYIDIGTNGEIVIGNSEWMVTAACSAGPAFEGGGIKHGMRATLGAIEDFRLNPVTFEPMLLTIGMVKPKGICGSGSPQRSQSTQRRFRKKLYSIFF